MATALGGGGGGSERGGGGGGSDVDMGGMSDGLPGVLALKVKGSDGVRSVYDRFKGVGGVNEQTAPHLFAYLAEEKELSLRL